MQQCIVMGNVSQIRRIEGTNKVYITIADHYNGKDAETGKYVQKTNFVPLQGFLPEGLEIVPGQLVAATFRVTSYKSQKSGFTETACDFDTIDVRFNNISKEKRDAKKAEAAGSVEEAPEAEGEGEAEGEEMPFGGEEAPASEEAPAKKGKKSAAKNS